MKAPAIKFKVLGKLWKLRILTKSQYRRKNGDDSVGITRYHKRRIDLSPKGQDIETIIHELFHAMLYEMCTHSATLRSRDFEEVCAELMAKRGKELLALADHLLERVRDYVSKPGEAL